MRILGLMLLNAAIAPAAAYVLLWGTEGWHQFILFYLGHAVRA